MSIQLQQKDGALIFKSESRELAKVHETFGLMRNPYYNDELYDSFLGDDLDARYSPAEGTDAATSIAILSAQDGGWLRLTSGATAVIAESLVSVTHGLNWKASLGGLYFDALLKTGSVTTGYFFAGFTDTLATTTLEEPISISGTTLTTAATNAVGFVFDTAATTDVLYLQGVKANTDTALLSSGIAPPAATFMRLTITVDTAGTAVFYIDGAKVGTVANAVTASTRLTPIVALDNRAATLGRTLDLDYIHVLQKKA